MKYRKSLAALVVTSAGFVMVAQTPLARAVPGPEVEYVYDVMVRRHYDFPNNDAIGYGYGLCDKVARGEGYTQVMGGEG
jgi:hypothetical protein